MTGTNAKLAAAVESYFGDLGRVRASGSTTGERPSYGPLANLLNAVGAALKPRVFCVGELASMGDVLSALGNRTFDIYLNGEAFWRNVPTAVWHYRLGGYQVLKKWLSYRERGILNGSLWAEEVQHFTDTTRRRGYEP